mmetsp:Transcript_2063/g.3537  ORF Transcript_2063/g.3537 Transcript_2063/m.3537 type:complete len:91 (+) Transcript_2063:619-891(+)
MISTGTSNPYRRWVFATTKSALYRRGRLNAVRCFAALDVVYIATVPLNAKKLIGPITSMIVIVTICRDRERRKVKTTVGHAIDPQEISMH